MPQSFFLVKNFSEPKIQQVITTVANIDVFGHDFQNIAAYNPEAIKRAVGKHITENWQASIPISGNNLAIKHHLVPLPNQIKSLKGFGFDFNIKTLTYGSEFENSENVSLLRQYLNKDLRIKLLKIGEPRVIIKKINTNNPEAYKLSLQDNKIMISAATTAGVFYGIQTLRQLWNQSRKLPAMQINDEPRLKYRGVLLDTARHFFTVNEIKKLIDAMAAMKLNKLHIHFTDDEGWSLALKALPKWAQKNASTRGYVKGSSNPAALYEQANFDITNYKNFDPTTRELLIDNYPRANTKYSGIYTKQQIKELIKYANTRQITIIPELDFPGHARA